MGTLKEPYIHWWQNRREYWGVTLWIAVLNAAIGGCLYLFGKGQMGALTIGSIGYVGLIIGSLGLFGARAAVKVRLIFSIRQKIAEFPEEKSSFWLVWMRYLRGYLLIILPVLVVPLVIWYEAPLCLLLLRWRMHFLPYTGVLEPERDMGRNGIRRGQGMVWPVCVTAIGTKWAGGLIYCITVLSLWLAKADGWVMGAIAAGAILSMVVEPLYQTGNLLLYARQYRLQTKPGTFWMDMKEGCADDEMGYDIYN